jgi:HSP20 family protein
MAQLLPESWKEPLRRLREDIHSALDRWSRRRAKRDREESENLPVLLSEKVMDLGTNLQRAVARLVPRRLGSHWSDDDGDLWFPSFFDAGGPALDIQETDEEVMVAAEMPGLDKDDFAVEISDNRLVLRGEKRRSAEERGSGYYYAERSFGSFVRVAPLPCEVDTEHVKATYKNGLLRVVMPKRADARAYRIKVKVS